MAVIPAAALLAGASAGLIVSDFPVLPGYAALGTGLASAVGCWRARRPHSLAAAVGLTFFVGGALLAADAWHKAWRPPLRLIFEQLARDARQEAEARGDSPPEDDRAFVTLTGVLRADASLRPTGVSLSLDVVSPGRGGVLLTVGGIFAAERVGEWRAGRVVRVPAELRRPSRYLNPGVPDEERIFARRGTTLVGSVKSGTLVEVVADGGWLSESAAAVRAFVRRAIRSSVGRWSARSAAIVTAIVIGDRAGLDDAVERRLQEAGTYHVIAISGGNIAILAGLTLVGFRVAGLLGRVAMITAIAGLMAYCYLVGGGASVNRATLMAIVYFGARAIDLRGPPINALALVAGLMVAVQPFAVADPGFLLTFGATGAIVLAVPLVPLRTLPPLIAALVAMLAASIAAELALLPVAAFLFARVTVAGLVLNFAAIPLMAIAQIAGMAVVPATWIWAPLATIPGWIAFVAAEGLVRSGGLIDLVPALTWRVAPPGWAAILTYYAGVSAAFASWRIGAHILGSRQTPTFRFIRWAAAATALVSCIWIAAEPWTRVDAKGDGRLHITFIDVGQGDSAFVRFPQGSTLLVDAGGLVGVSSFDIGDRVVAPVLRDSGVRRLSALALTHGDADHVGGAGAIVAEFRPHDVWEGVPVPPLQALRALQQTARQIGASWTNVQSNDVVTIDGVQIIVRHPPIADWERQDVRNEDSIVLEFVWRDVSVVFTGDIEKDAERTIAPLFAPSPIRILKVPHHGSLTSSTPEFIRALSPRVAVVSVGRTNTFGHPAPDVIERYRRIAAEVFRTDQDGAVTIDTDGYLVDIRTFTGRRTFVRKQARRHETPKP